MADNPFAERPKTDRGPKQCPPDMPRGETEADKAARRAYWIQRGNEGLDAAGNHHLQWKSTDGNYWIEPR